MNPALYQGALQKLYRYDAERVLVWGFNDNASGSKVMFVSNLSSSDQTLTNVPWLADSVWYDIFDQSVFKVPSSPVASFQIPAYTVRVFANKTNAELGVVTGVNESLPTVPMTFGLLQNFPNPFNPSTTIRYSVAHEEIVTVTVYDLLGRVVHQLVNARQPAGIYEARFDGGRLPSGLYICTMRAGKFEQSSKLLLLK